MIKMNYCMNRKIYNGIWTLYDCKFNIFNNFEILRAERGLAILSSDLIFNIRIYGIGTGLEIYVEVY